MSHAGTPVSNFSNAKLSVSFKRPITSAVLPVMTVSLVVLPNYLLLRVTLNFLSHSDRSLLFPRREPSLQASVVMIRHTSTPTHSGWGGRDKSRERQLEIPLPTITLRNALHLFLPRNLLYNCSPQNSDSQAILYVSTHSKMGEGRQERSCLRGIY